MSVDDGVLPFSAEDEIEASLPAVVAQLARNGVIAYPTETVYGFGTSRHQDALASLARIKATPAERSFISLIAGMDMLHETGGSLTPEAVALAGALWPGPLTLLLPSDGGGKTAVRWTPHSGAQRIILAFGSPITSTSANRSGLPPAATAEEIVREWRPEILRGELVVLDAGVPIRGQPSTIVDCTASPPRLTRHGAIHIDIIRAIVPAIQ